MVALLLKQLLAYPEVGRLILTLNMPECLTLPDDNRIIVIKNAKPQGFSVNNNAAFAFCKTNWFVVLNPDVVLLSNPFPALMHAANQTNVALASPLAMSSQGMPEDGWRHFPTLLGLLRRWSGNWDGRYAHAVSDTCSFPVEWVSGMCMCFRAEAYSALGGFDEGFFLYYEDVDICVRAWQMRMRVLACPEAMLIHDGQRASRRSISHMYWYFKSMLRYFVKHWRHLPREAVL